MNISGKLPYRIDLRDGPQKRVPLVVYRNGIREVIGEAQVFEDGNMNAVIHDTSLTGTLLEGLGEMSISVATDKAKTKQDATTCWGCAMGKCGQNFDDATCGCCRTAHLV